MLAVSVIEYLVSNSARQFCKAFSVLHPRALVLSHAIPRLFPLLFSIYVYILRCYNKRVRRQKNAL